MHTSNENYLCGLIGSAVQNLRHTNRNLLYDTLLKVTIWGKKWKEHWGFSLNRSSMHDRVLLTWGHVLHNTTFSVSNYIKCSYWAASFPQGYTNLVEGGLRGYTHSESDIVAFNYKSELFVQASSCLYIDMLCWQQNLAGICARKHRNLQGNHCLSWKSLHTTEYVLICSALYSLQYMCIQWIHVAKSSNYILKVLFLFSSWQRQVEKYTEREWNVIMEQLIYSGAWQTVTHLELLWPPFPATVP